MSKRDDDRLIPLLHSIDASLATIAHAIERAFGVSGKIEQCLGAVVQTMQEVKQEIDATGSVLSMRISEATDRR